MFAKEKIILLISLNNKDINKLQHPVSLKNPPDAGWNVIKR